MRRVTGGATWRGKDLGKVVRWVYTTDGDAIRYKKNGNKVSKSDGAFPVMELGELPENVDDEKYINEAKLMLKSVGMED